MKRLLKNILVTGGAGFIGSNFIRYVLKKTDFSGKIINLDALTYCGNLESLQDIQNEYSTDRYIFIHGDITDRNLVRNIFEKYDIDTVVHFAAESHVDRSILGPEAFINTNIGGTFTLLNCAKSYWLQENGIRQDVLFHNVGTDEVYGSLGNEGYFTEKTAYDPRSPYSASKASSDHLTRAYFHTYGLPITISNCSNNYGPYQFPEKLIPLMILNIKNKKELPVYGDGMQIRDWLFVEDHNAAVWTILQKGTMGETYNIGGENEWENIRLLDKLIELTAKKLNYTVDNIKKLIRNVKDRPGHDRRYAIDCSKLKKELGWSQSFSFEEGLSFTVDWYLQNTEWSEHIFSGAYKDWLTKNYDERNTHV